ncbi:hypothetical protein GF314_08335 [bacterium]|nr:hypothetical protein [bacterium]
MNQVKNPLQRTDQESLDMRSLVEVLIRRRWIILLVAAPVVLVAMIGTLRSTQTFRARSTVMIEVGGPQTPQFYQRSVNLDMVLSSAAELGMSAPVAELAAEALADSIPAFQERYPEYFAEVSTVDDLQEVIHGGATSTHVGESNLLNLSFSHPVAPFALTGAEALANAFIEFNVSTSRNERAVGYYTDQIRNTKTEIDSLYDLRKAVLDTAGMLGLTADLRMTVTQIRGLESEYFRARSKREGLEAELSTLERAVANDPEFIPNVPERDAGSLNRLKAALDVRVTRLTELRQRYAEDSIWVEREKAQIEMIREELLRERQRYMQSLRVDLAEARAVEQSYDRAQRAQMGGLARYPSVQADLELIDMQITGLRDLLGSLQRKRGEVRMSADRDIRITDVFLIEEPTLDVPVGRGRKMLYLIISVVLAIAMGLVAAFFVESNDHRIYDRRRAELYLEVPVLGSLPDTTSKKQT